MKIPSMKRTTGISKKIFEHYVQQINKRQNKKFIVTIPSSEGKIQKVTFSNSEMIKLISLIGLGGWTLGKSLRNKSRNSFTNET